MQFVRVDDLKTFLEAGFAGRYDIGRELGRGGMATVLLAQDLKYDRPVALKVLHPEFAAALGTERFQREIRLTARLQHPHILPVLDSGETGGRVWFTMPYVEGGTLRSMLQREVQLPVAKALRITCEAAQALAYAHAHGIIHRDIKPENLLLTGDGSTLVSDFGIARAVGDDAGRLTETGLTLGTPAYMSPEQASGDRGLDGRTDVYSLGAVLYEMLAGEPPYTGPTAQAIATKRLSQPVPSLRSVRPGVPVRIDRAVTRALSPIAADRFPTASEFAQELQRAEGASDATVVAPVLTRPSSPTRLLPAGLTLFAVLVVLGLVFTWRRIRSPGESAGPRHLAVLPFENEGDSVDGYFAEGLTDELRGKLATISGLEVIASRSSNTYRSTSESLPQIARDLGVSYLLIGKVRWVKGTGDPGRVQVSPELVRIVPGAAPITKWAEPFDAPFTDVFQVQADIAGRVAQALDVALAPDKPRSLATPVTTSAEAYDTYLRADQYYERGTIPDLQLAGQLYRQAIGHDSSFALAWARLARSDALLYRLRADRSAAELEGVEHAARHALTLAPDLPEAHAAMGYYYFWGLSDYAHALEEFTVANRGEPNDAELVDVIGLVQRREGRWDEASATLQRAFALDPRSSFVLEDVGETYLRMRRYTEAEQALDRATALSPDGPFAYELLMRLYVNRDGDLDRSRQIARQALSRMAFGRLFGSGFRQLGLLRFYGLIVFDTGYQGDATSLTPAQMGDDTLGYFVFKSSLFRYRSELNLARAYEDSVRTAALRVITRHEDNAFTQAELAVADAYLGHGREAIEAGKRAEVLTPPSKDAVLGQEGPMALAEVYAVLGDADDAVSQLQALLTVPSFVSVAWLRTDPIWAPLRGNARFRRLTG
jgi:serine/threonine protein kinase